MAGTIRICGSDGTLGAPIPGVGRPYELAIPAAALELPLNETSGMTATSLQGATATTSGGLVMGGTDGPAGLGGKAVQLDGVDDYIQVADTGLVSGLPDWTVAIWVSTSDTDAPIYCERSAAGTSSLRFGLDSNRSVFLVLTDSAGGSVRVTAQGGSGTVYSDWTMLAARRGGNRMEMCVNAASVVTGATPPGTLNDADIDTRLGVNTRGSGFYQGALARLRVFDRALSDEELWALYSKDTPLRRQTAPYTFPCAPTSIWRKPLADDAPLHANSANFITELTRLRGLYPYGLALGNGGYTSPVFIVGNDQPTQPVRILYGTTNPGGQALYDAMQAVPIPDNAFSAKGTDGHMVIYRPPEMWEFWVMGKVLLPPTWINGVAGTGGTLPPADYRYMVAPQNENGENTASGQTGVKVTVGAGGAADLTWQRVDLATGYGIYRRLESGDTFEYLTSVPQDADNGAFHDDGSITPDPGRTVKTPAYQNGTDTATTNDWGCKYGGYMPNVPASIGHFTAPHANWGATATSLPVWGGMVTLNEALDAEAGNVDAIQHAVNGAIPIVEASNQFFYPAQRTDGGKSTANAIREGTRFRLPASIDVTALNTTNFCKAYARAVQKYGWYIRDVSGAITVCYIEDDSNTGRDFSRKIMSGGNFASGYQNYVLRNFPWDQLQVVDPAYTQAQSAGA